MLATCPAHLTPPFNHSNLDHPFKSWEVTCVAETHTTCRNLLARVFHARYYMVSTLEHWTNCHRKTGGGNEFSGSPRGWPVMPVHWLEEEQECALCSCIPVLTLWNSCLLTEGELESTSSYLWKRRSAVFLCQISIPFQLRTKLFTFATLVNLKRLVTVSVIRTP
jgi:hypothetical protein